MIRINLALRKQPSYVGSGIGGARTSTLRGLTSLKIDKEALRELPLVRVGLVVAAMFLASWVLEDYKKSEIKRIETEISQLNARLQGLQGAASKLKDYESLRDSLVKDTVMIQSKIDTIQKLISERKESVNLLLVLSESIPSDVWITKFRADQVIINIEGRSAGFGQVSDFIKKLGESAYFQDVNMDNATADRDQESGTEVATFRLSTKRKPK